MTSTLEIRDRPCIQMGKYTLRFENVELEPEEKEKARLELRETPEVVEKSLKELRELLKDEVKLKYPSEDDLQLQVFLRPCKYYPQSALERIYSTWPKAGYGEIENRNFPQFSTHNKQIVNGPISLLLKYGSKMRKFYTFKLKNPKYCENLIPSCEKRAFYMNLLTILPSRNKNGERVLLLEAGKKWDTKECTLVEIFRSVMLILEAAIAEPKTQVSGVHVVLDMAGLSLQHVWQFSASFAKHVVEWVQECLPIRLKGIHVVNQPYIFNMVFALFKPFLGEKLQKRIHFHGSSFKNLHYHISPSVLPLQYGGTEDIPLDMGEGLHKYLLCFENEFKERSKCGYVC